jgi:23S rRNA (uridine2552-2'-O)-methyltransferase
MNKRPQDHFGHRARKEGFAARSVYKLEEIDRRMKLLAPGKRVLDLGAFPGSWTSYAATKVGPKGRVLGIDQKEFRGALPPWAQIIMGDALTLDLAQEHGPGSFDVVLSDMAPATTGHKFVDQTRSFDLFAKALAVAEVVLPAGGHFVGKIFLGPDFEQAKKQVHRIFEETKIVKPPASRLESYETFLVGLRKRGSIKPGP